MTRLATSPPGAPPARRPCAAAIRRAAVGLARARLVQSLAIGGAIFLVAPRPRDDRRIEIVAAGGLPMGSNITIPAGRTGAPRIVVFAARDPLTRADTASLAEIDLVEAWVDPATGAVREQVVRRTAPPGGVATSCQSFALDPAGGTAAFHPGSPSFSCARVLRTPTSRWSCSTASARRPPTRPTARPEASSTCRSPSARGPAPSGICPGRGKPTGALATGGEWSKMAAMTPLVRAAILCLASAACAPAASPAPATPPPAPAAAPAPGAVATPAAAVVPAAAPAAAPAAPAPRPPAKTVHDYVEVSTPRTVLSHIRVIDGTGKPAAEDRNVTIEHGKITAIDAGADVAPADGTTVIDGHGKSVMPGIVGMHDHMFYIARPNYDEHWNSEPPVIVLVVVKGDPATRISDIENVEVVFKDGVGYDPDKLLASVKAHYGQY